MASRPDESQHAVLLDHIEKTGNAPPGGFKESAAAPKRANPDFEGEGGDDANASFVSAAGPSKPAKAKPKPIAKKTASKKKP